MSQSKNKAEQSARLFIIIASLFIPIAVAVLYIMPKVGPEAGLLRDLLNMLPALNATINGTTAIILVLAVLAIRNKQVLLHKRLMTVALALSVLFLLSYIGYHATSETTPFPQNAEYRGLYLIILLTHIIISGLIVPFVLITYSRALAERFDKHKKIAKWTFPLWLYVTVTGVIVYFMISPYYPF
jgi:putative membrane protein